MEVSSCSSDLPMNVYFKIVHRVVDCLKYLIPFRKNFEQIVRTFSTQVHHSFSGLLCKISIQWIENRK